MPREDRRIFFDFAELYAALYTMKQKLQGTEKRMPPGAITALLRPDGDEHSVAVLVQDSDHGTREELIVSETFLTAALVLYCRHEGIPVAKRSRKQIELTPEAVVLRARLDESGLLETKFHEGKTKKHGVRFYPPPNVLRAKARYDAFSHATIARAEALIDNSGIDFIPHVTSLLDALENSLVQGARMPVAGKQVIEDLSRTLVDFKSAGMFGYPLISQVAAVGLDFLESLAELNADAFDVLAAHNKTVDVIVRNRIVGDGGPEGRELIEELRETCKRYYRRHRIEVWVK